MNRFKSAHGVLRELGGSMKETRERDDIGLREAARQIGISASHLSAIEAGTKSPTIAVAMKVLAWLGKK